MPNKLVPVKTGIGQLHDPINGVNYRPDKSGKYNIMRPIIGITSDYKYGNKPAYHLDEFYAQTVFDAGGQPFIIPPLADVANATEIIRQISGLIISGGDFDVDPKLYGEEPHPKLGQLNPLRTRYESSLALEAFKRKLPVLGICGGIQLINVLAGGTLYQDISSQHPNPIIHQQTHNKTEPSHMIKLDTASRLYRIIGQEQLAVNSTHHQAVKDIGRGFKAVAWSPDGLIEAIESSDSTGFVLGVQWHPEALYQTYDIWQKLFTEFVFKAQTGI